MTYPENLIAPMRAELTRHGIEEARTAADVDRILHPNSGSVMIITNSICGCAAGKARPAIAMALGHPVKPEKTATVFAGADLEAVARLREILSDYPPSSPSVAIFRDGRPVYVLHRRQIEQSDAVSIARNLTDAFDRVLETRL